MRAKIVGMSTWQGTPRSGTLTVWPDERYEDGNGNATVGRLDYVLDVASRTWRDAHNPLADAYAVVAAPGEPSPSTAMFEEVFTYVGRAPVRTIFRKELVASDLNATEYSYISPQNVQAYNSREPLTMEAARQFLGFKPELEEAVGMFGQVLANIQGSQAAAATAIGNIAIVGAAQAIKRTRAETETALTDGGTGVVLDSQEVILKTGSNISRLGFLTTDTIPLRGLSSMDAVGDFQSRIADAQTYQKPLSGSGGLYELTLANPLELGLTRLQDAEIRTETAAGKTAFTATGTRTQIAAGWNGVKGTSTLTIPNHGCSRNDLIFIEGVENWNPARVYYLTGQVCRVLEVPTANSVKISEPLKFDYAGAALYRVGRQENRGSLRDIVLREMGAANAYGLTLKYGQGRLIDNVRAEGYKYAALTVESCVGQISGFESHDTYFVGTPTSYGLAVTELCDLDIWAIRASGGRHAVAHGGSRPAVSRFTGGRLDGGLYAQAFDAHGGVWSVTLENMRIAGGMTLAAYRNVVDNCEVSMGNTQGAALLGLGESPAGASITMNGGSLTKKAAAGDVACVRVIRSATDQDGAPLADVQYGDVVLNDVTINHEASGSTTYDRMFYVDATLNRFEVTGRFKTTLGGVAAKQPSRISVNRIKTLKIAVDNDGEAVWITETGNTAALRAAPDHIEVSGYWHDVGNAANLQPVLSLGSQGATVYPFVDARGLKLARNAAGAWFNTIKLLLTDPVAERNGLFTANTPYRGALSFLDVTEARIGAATHINELDPATLYGIYASGETTLWFDGAARVRAPNTPVKLVGNAAIADRSQLREARTIALAPNIFASATIAATDVAGGATLAIPVTLATVVTGEAGAIGSTPTLPAGLVVQSVLGTAAGIMTITLKNTTAGTLAAPAGNYTAIAYRWSSLKGTYTAAALSVPANGTKVISIPVGNTAAGDFVTPGPRPTLEAGLTQEGDFVAGTNVVTVTLRNNTAAAIAHSGVWSARIQRA